MLLQWFFRLLTQRSGFGYSYLVVSCFGCYAFGCSCGGSGGSSYTCGDGCVLVVVVAFGDVLLYAYVLVAIVAVLLSGHYMISNHAILLTQKHEPCLTQANL